MTLLETTSASVKRRSKNDLFTTNFRTEGPFTRSTPENSPTLATNLAWPSAEVPANSNKWLSSGLKKDAQRKPSPARSHKSTASTEKALSPALTLSELPTELLDFVVPDDIPDHYRDVQVRLSPTKTYLLGLGRHSCVYLASHRTSPDANWNLCAAKRVNRDPEAQQSALKEAYILGLLETKLHGSRKHILRFLGMKREEDLELWSPPYDVDSRSRSSSTADSAHSIGLGFSNSSSIRTSSDHLDIPINTTPSSGAHTPERPKLHLRHSSSIQSIPAAAFSRSSELEASVRRANSLREPLRSSRSSMHEPYSPLGNDSRLVMLLELCPGGTIAAMLRRQPHLVSRSLWLKWSRQIADALNHCHSRGILHADIKSQNIMLSENLDAYLTDFGMSMSINRANLPTEGLGLGTTVYNAPELVRPSPYPFGFAADVYAFGVTLNVLLTGHEPYFNCRSSVEQMLWVSKGAYWEWETRRRLSEIGNTQRHSRNLSDGSGKPSNFRSFFPLQEANASVDSFDSAKSFVRASPSLGSRSRRGLSARAIASLLSESGEEMVPSALKPISSSLAAEDSSDDDGGSPSSPTDSYHQSSQAQNGTSSKSYSDGSPVQYFLSSSDPVPEGILRLLERMTHANPDHRPRMAEVVQSLAVF